MTAACTARLASGHRRGVRCQRETGHHGSEVGWPAWHRADGVWWLDETPGAVPPREPARPVTVALLPMLGMLLLAWCAVAPQVVHPQREAPSPATAQTARP